MSTVGHLPIQDYGIPTQTGAIGITGNAPGVAESEVITPTGGAVIVGGIPSVVVRGSVKTPITAALTLVGAAPKVSQSRVITPPTGAIAITGSAPIINNPNWVNIDDSQTPNWQLIAA